MATHRFILDALTNDWYNLSTSPTSRAHLSSWQRTYPAFASVGDVGALIELIRSAPVEESSELVWALLDAARTEPFARRVVLQVIVPGLRREAGALSAWARHADLSLVTGGDVDQMLMAAAVEAIDHAVGQRRAWPIRSILRRTRRVLLKELRSADRWYGGVVLDERRIDVESHTIDDAVTPAERLLAVLGSAATAGTVSAVEAELVWLSRAGGFGPADLEAHFGTNYECLRRRRYRAEQRLVGIAEAV